MNTRRMFDVVLAIGAVCSLAAAVHVSGVMGSDEPKRSSSFKRQSIKDASDLTTRGSRLGNQDAPIVLVEFTDFQCQFCRRLHSSLQEIVARNPTKVVVVFRHFPLSNHTLAFPLAVASECAAAQGRFSEFVDLTFALQDSLGRIPAHAIAARAGVSDTIAFNACQRSSTIEDRVLADIAAGKALAFEGTPALILGSRMIVGAAPIDTILQFVREGTVRESLRR